MRLIKVSNCIFLFTGYHRKTTKRMLNSKYRYIALNEPYHANDACHQMRSERISRVMEHRLSENTTK